MREVLQRFDQNIKAGFIKLDNRVTVENNRIQSELNDEQIRVNQELSEVKQAVNDLEHIVDDTFKDGVIDEQEAIAIEKHLNRLKSEKADVDGKYVVIVTNTYLRGADRAGLIQAKTAFDEAHDNLIGSILEAIEDSKTTPQEKQNVDNAFDLYNQRLGELSTAFQVAIESIQNTQLEELKIGGRNLVLKGNENKVKANGVLGGLFGSYDTSKPMAVGGKYTLVWRAKTTSAQGVRIASGTDLTIDKNESLEYEVRSKVFTATSLTSKLNLYHEPIGEGGKTTTSEIDWVMLFQGEVKAPEDFIPSPEDVEESIIDGTNASKAYTDAREVVIKNANELYTKDEISASEAKTLIELENKAREAKEYADGISQSLTTDINTLKDNVQKEVDELETSIDNLENALDNLPIGQELTEVEKQGLRSSLHLVGMEYADVLYKIDVITKDKYLPSTNKTTLSQRRTDLVSKYNSVKNSIETALQDSTITQEERDAIDLAMTNFRSSIDSANVSLIEGYEAIEVARDADLQSKLNQQKQELEKEIQDVTDSLGELEDNIKDAIEDGIITEAEALAIKQNINNLKVQKTEMDAKYNTIYTNPLLVGAPKTDLASKKTAFNTAHDNLINSINTAIADNQVTPAESADVDAKFTAYATALGSLTTSIEVAVKSITDGMGETLRAELEAQRQALQTEIDDVNNAMGGLEDTIKDAILDGIITESEAMAIKQHINNLKVQKAELDSRYTVIYNNVMLVGAPKTDLQNKKTAFNTAHTNLINSIETAIADDNVTPTESADVDAKFTAYATALGNLTTSIENAIKTITNIIDGKADEAILEASNAVNTANIAREMTNFLETNIEGNVIATGTLLVGGASTVGNAGITGVTDAEDKSVRIWAGKQFTDRYTAPFQILHDGTLKATEAHIEGDIVADSLDAKGVVKVNNNAGLSGLNDTPYTFTPTASQVYLTPYDPEPPVGNVILRPVTMPRLRFWAGETEENKYLAPFKIFDDGSYVATKGKVGGFSIGNGILEHQPYSFKLESGTVYRVGEKIRIGAGEFNLSYNQLADDGSYCGEVNGSPACVIVPSGSPDRFVKWDIKTGKQGTTLSIKRSGLHPSGMDGGDIFEGVLVVENANSISTEYPAIRATKGSIVVNNGVIAVGTPFGVDSDVGIWTDKRADVKGLTQRGRYVSIPKVIDQSTAYSVTINDYHLIVKNASSIKMPAYPDTGMKLIIDNVGTSGLVIDAPPGGKISNMGTESSQNIGAKGTRYDFTYINGMWYYFKSITA